MPGQSPSAPPNILESSGLPLVYAIDPGDDQIPTLPEQDGHDVVTRTSVRSLTVMQKEAVVSRSGSPVAWRLSSDEGPYLQGHDVAPAPLAVTAAGLAADLMQRVREASEAAGLPVEGLTLTLDTYYTIEGSMLRGTMRGGADPPDITVSFGAVAPPSAAEVVGAGIGASVTAGLLRTRHTSLFSLTSHGRRIPVGRAAELENDVPLAVEPAGSPHPDPAHPGAELVQKLQQVEAHPTDAGVALQESQRRTLHLRATGGWVPDGRKQIDVRVIRPTGSTFRILSDEPPGAGGRGRAPDALTLISAGLGFCFMTQIGRFAKIAKHHLGSYRIVQDMRFTPGEVTAASEAPGRAAAPRTHVYLAPDGDDDFARTALDMSEQTCFLHAMCRTELEPNVEIAGAP